MCRRVLLTRDESEGFLKFCADHGFQPCPLQWPPQATQLLDSMVSIARAHYEATHTEEVHGTPGILGTAPSDVEMSETDIENSAHNLCIPAHL